MVDGAIDPHTKHIELAWLPRRNSDDPRNHGSSPFPIASERSLATAHHNGF
jgi:hypothetical protein